MTKTLRQWGPYEEEWRAWTEANAAGFPVPVRQVAITFAEGREDIIEEDATSWTGADDSSRRVLVIALPDKEQRLVPGGLEFEQILDFEKRWTWPWWSEVRSLVIYAPPDFEPARANGIALLRSRFEGFERVDRTEMLGLGRSGRTMTVVRRPPRRETVREAMRVLRDGVEFCLL